MSSSSAPPALPAEPATVYEKNGVDYGEWVDHFLTHEEDYYNYIHSFADGKSTLLRIQDANGKRISSAVLLANAADDDGYAILEVKRPGALDFERQEHDSIEDWYISAVGDNDNYHTEIFDSIFIGDQKVPLWRVLVVADEEQESGIEGGDEAEAVNPEPVKAYSSDEDYVENLLLMLFIMLLALLGTFVYVMLITEGLYKDF